MQQGLWIQRSILTDGKGAFPQMEFLFERQFLYYVVLGKYLQLTGLRFLENKKHYSAHRAAISSCNACQVGLTAEEQPSGLLRTARWDSLAAASELPGGKRAYL